jgi:hypothetical protein
VNLWVCSPRKARSRGEPTHRFTAEGTEGAERKGRGE